MAVTKRNKYKNISVVAKLYFSQYKGKSFIYPM